jgi:hypothetical protein
MKARFETVQQAMAHAEKVRALYSTGGMVQTAYSCPICGGWHLTSHPWKEGDGSLDGDIAEEA